MMSQVRADRFVEDMIQQLRDAGREVEVTREEDSIYFISPRSQWFEETLSGGAYRSDITGRWSFTHFSVYPAIGPIKTTKNRRSALIWLSVHGL